MTQVNTISTAETSSPKPCRWCAEQTDSWVCAKCEATQQPAVVFTNSKNDVKVQVYVNPDAGLFIEMCKKDGTVDRYTLSSELLRATGALQSFPEAVDGRKVI